MARLGDICKINMGQSPDSSTYNDHGIGLPFYQGNADFGEEYPSAKVYCSSPVKVAQKGDILISVRAPIGALNMANEKCCIGRGLAAITANEDVCDRQYLWYVLLSKVEELNAKGTGSTFKAINRNILDETEIPLIPIDDQKQISDQLDKVVSLISLRKKQLQKLDDLVKSRFVEMFGDVEKNSKHWNTVQLSQLCDLQNGYAFKSDDYLPKSNVINCRMSNIRPDGGFDAEYNPKYLPDEYWMKYQAYQLHDGDVIIAMTDMASDPKILGVPTIVKTKGKRFLLNQRVGKLIFLDDGRMNRVYLMYYLGQAFIRKNLAKLAGGSTQINVGKPEILSIKVQEPPAELQELFSNKYERIISFKQTVKQGLDKLEQMKQALMQKYFG